MIPCSLVTRGHEARHSARPRGRSSGGGGDSGSHHRARGRSGPLLAVAILDWEVSTRPEQHTKQSRSLIWCCADRRLTAFVRLPGRPTTRRALMERRRTGRTVNTPKVANQDVQRRCRWGLLNRRRRCPPAAWRARLRSSHRPMAAHQRCSRRRLQRWQRGSARSAQQSRWQHRCRVRACSTWTIAITACPATSSTTLAARASSMPMPLRHCCASPATPRATTTAHAASAAVAWPSAAAALPYRRCRGRRPRSPASLQLRQCRTSGWCGAPIQPRCRRAAAVTTRTARRCLGIGANAPWPAASRRVLWSGGATSGSTAAGPAAGQAARSPAAKSRMRSTPCSGMAWQQEGQATPNARRVRRGSMNMHLVVRAAESR